MRLAFTVIDNKHIGIRIFYRYRTRMVNMSRLIKQITSSLKKRTLQDDGFTLFEVLVASMIALIIILFSVLGLSQVYNNEQSIDSRSKALNLANSVLAVATQSPYDKLATPPITATDGTKCGMSTASTFNGETKVYSGTAFAGLTNCATTQYSGVGITYSVQTYVTYVRSSNFDYPSVNYFNGSPKRVTVVVTWAEKSDQDTGVAQTQTISSYKIYMPNIESEIPDFVKAG